MNFLSMFDRDEIILNKLFKRFFDDLLLLRLLHDFFFVFLRFFMIDKIFSLIERRYSSRAKKNRR